LPKNSYRRQAHDGIDSRLFFSWFYHGSGFVLYGTYCTNNKMVHELEISLSACCGINNLLLGQGVRQLVFYSLGEERIL